MSKRSKQAAAEVMGGEKLKQRPLRRRIRDTRRLLSREEIPESVRQMKERVLKSLKEELSEKLDEKRRKKISKQYRMVKFFEKRKVSRKLKAKLKLYESGSSENKAEVEEAISRLRMEVNYIEHYPEDVKYQALYPSTETCAKSLSTRESRLASIAERVASGELADVSVDICSAEPAVEVKGSQRGGVKGAKKGADVKGHSKLLKKTAPEGKDVSTRAERRKKRDRSKAPLKTAPEGKDVSTRAERRKKRDRSKAPLKAAVDEEPDSDCDLESRKKLLQDDDFFFLDTTGSHRTKHPHSTFIALN